MSSVCDVVAPYSQILELLGYIFAPCDSLGNRTLCVKILEINSKGFCVIVLVQLS